MDRLGRDFNLLGPHELSSRSTIQPVLLLVIGLAVVMLASALHADASFVWDRAAFWDGRYPSAWTGGETVRDTLEYAGYEILDADQLKAWMDERIVDGIPSVVVFCLDIAPDTVVESMSSTCTLRRYLDAGGKVVWYADIPMYYQGHADGSQTVWDVDGAVNILGFNAASGSWDSESEVVFTTDGASWGLTETWQSVRPTSSYSLRILARDTHGYTSAWVKHYIPGDNYRGFIRLFDRPGEPNIDDLRRVAEYPNVPEPIAWDNQAENEDDIVGVFFYPWYENPNTSGQWRHWNGNGYSPPTTWAACYLPNYPDSGWNPSTQLYDSKDTQVLRWQDRAMARAGVDIAVASWWGIGGYEDAGLAKAIRTCKSVRWCIYYEMEAYADPTVQRIYDDIKYVVDTYGPTRNYAKIDGKWLVLVYGAGGEETSNRWRQVKALLARNGYHVYLNGDRSSGREPWDAVHSYNPVVYQGYTHALPHVDDSAWVAPGFYGHTEESPRLKRTLSEFTSAWNNILANRNLFRFIFIETWNEWHEGTQIESGQEIVRDPQRFRPKLDGDYGYTFIDVIAPAAVNDLQWRTPGHRSVAPIKLEAEEMIWDDDLKVLEESPTECRITEPDTRIGSSILVPNSGDAVFTVRAKAVIQKTGRFSKEPELMLYLDDIGIQCWIIGSSYKDHSTAVPIPKGIHKLELAMTDEPIDANWDVVVDFVDVDVVWAQNPVTTESQVLSSQDDGYASNESLQNLDGAYLRVGASSFVEPPYYVCGMVYRNMDIPQGAEIISAYLKIRSYNSRLTDIVHGKIEAEAADNVSPFGSSHQMGSMLRTSASVNWDHSEPWAEDTWYISPNIANVIQEVINRSGWSPRSGSLAILYSTRERAGGNRNISAYDRGSDYAPKLEITYAP